MANNDHRTSATVGGGRKNGSSAPRTSELPCARTERFAKPASTRWHVADGYDWSDTPACRESSFGHRLELHHPLQPGATGRWFRRWENHHRGKGVERAYVTFETPLPWTAGAVRDVSCDVLSVLLLSDAAPVLPVPDGVVLRPLVEGEDWRQLLCLSVRVEGEDDPALVRYLTWYLDGLRARQDAGGGCAWGAFVGSTLVASAFLLWSGGEGRFQHVQTHPDFRRRGLCSALLTTACRVGRAEAQVGPIVIAATAESSIARLYRGLGFVPCSWFVTLGRSTNEEGP